MALIDYEDAAKLFKVNRVQDLISAVSTHDIYWGNAEKVIGAINYAWSVAKDHSTRCTYVGILTGTNNKNYELVYDIQPDGAITSFTTRKLNLDY